MSHCEDVRPLLISYLDRETNEDETSRVLEHIEGCPSCAGELETHRKIGDVMAGLCRPRAMPHRNLRPSFPPNSPGLPDSLFIAQVRAEAQGRTVARRKIARRTLWVLQAVALLLISLGLAGWLGRPSGGAFKPAEELISNLDLLEELNQAGLEPTPELVQLLMDGPNVRDPRNGDLLDTSLFESLLEEEVATEKL